MKTRSASGSGMFLIELMLGIMIFAIAAAVCLKVFVTANDISTDSTELNRAVIAAQNSAECFKATGGDLAKTAGLLGKNFTAGDVLTYDMSDLVVEITRISAQSGLIDAAVSVKNQAGEQIFSIPVTVLEVTP